MRGKVTQEQEKSYFVELLREYVYAKEHVEIPRDPMYRGGWRNYWQDRADEALTAIKTFCFCMGLGEMIADIEDWTFDSACVDTIEDMSVIAFQSRFY